MSNINYICKYIAYQYINVCALPCLCRTIYLFIKQKQK